MAASPLRTSALLVLASVLVAVPLRLLFCSSPSSPFFCSPSPRQSIALDSILGHDDRLSSLIVKLNASTGEWLPFEGITIIMRVIDRALPIYQTLYSELATFPAVSPLTTASFHVTLSSVLPRAKLYTLATYNDLIRLYHPRFEHLKAVYALLPPQPLVFTPADLQLGGTGLSFELQPKTERDRELLRGYKEVTREVLGSAYAFNERYHLSAAYKKLDRVKEVAAPAWDELLQRLTQLLAGTDVVVGPPALCQSISMLQFDPL